jgi:hypothetical protein
MAIKYINIFQSYVGPKIFAPNWDFGFENKPSGNPVRDCVKMLPDGD